MCDHLYGYSFSISQQDSPYQWSFAKPFFLYGLASSLCWVLPLIFFGKMSLLGESESCNERVASIGMFLIWVAVVACTIQVFSVDQLDPTIDGKLGALAEALTTTIACWFVLLARKAPLRYALPLAATTIVMTFLLTRTLLDVVMRFAKYMERATEFVMFSESRLGWSVSIVAMLWLGLAIADFLGVEFAQYRKEEAGQALSRK